MSMRRSAVLLLPFWDMFIILSIFIELKDLLYISPDFNMKTSANLVCAPGFLFFSCSTIISIASASFKTAAVSTL